MDQEKIGKFISSKRKEKDLTQKELADKLGVTDKAVSKWERGVGCPDISYLDNLSNILGVSILELLRGETIENVEINKDALLESMMYSKEMTKNRIKLVINTILVSIILITSLVLVFFNVRNYFYLNSEYENYYKEESDIDLNKYYDIILNNQGKYTDEEYKIIVDYVNKTKVRLNDEKKEYLYKEKATMKDCITFIENTHFIDDENGNISIRAGLDIYPILLKYDLSKYENFVHYINNLHTVLRAFNDLGMLVEYRYSYTNNSSGGESLFLILYYEFTKDELLLKDIIEVGELDV